MHKTVTLKDVADYSDDKIPINEVSLENFITTDNILQNKQGIKCAVNLPPQEGNLIKYGRGDILIANIRPYLKKIWFSDREGGASADVLVIKVKKEFDPRFVYYALFRDDFFEHVMNGSKGTKMPRGDKNQIMDFLIPYLPKFKQEAIAFIPTILDKKIELNNQINKELESMAKTLYDYWFVQFDFPDTNGNPYKSSGGKMVYSDELKREIPEGWEIKELSDIANITMGQSPSGDSYNNDMQGTIFFQGCTDFGWRYPSVRQYTTEPSRMAKSGDVLLSVRAPVGTLNIADNDCCIGRGLASLHSKEGFDSYLYYVMVYFKKIFDHRNSAGTTFGSITKDDLYSLKFVYPHRDYLVKYDNIVSQYNKKILNNHKQTQKLTQLRDWLLPMLMNGQVKVSDDITETDELMVAEPVQGYGESG